MIFVDPALFTNKNGHLYAAACQCHSHKIEIKCTHVSVDPLYQSSMEYANDITPPCTPAA